MYSTGEDPQVGDTVSITTSLPGHPHHTSRTIGQVTRTDGGISVTVYVGEWPHTAQIKGENLKLMTRATEA